MPAGDIVKSVGITAQTRHTSVAVGALATFEAELAAVARLH